MTMNWAPDSPKRAGNNTNGFELEIPCGSNTEAAKDLIEQLAKEIVPNAPGLSIDTLSSGGKCVISVSSVDPPSESNLKFIGGKSQPNPFLSHTDFGSFIPPILV